MTLSENPQKWENYNIPYVIQVERGSIDFGSILVGSSKTDSLVLYNDFHCDLHFRLHLKQVIDNEYGEESNSK